MTSSRSRRTGDQGPEAHGLRRGQQAQQRLDRVAHAGAHRGDVLGVDHRPGGAASTRSAAARSASGGPAPAGRAPASGRAPPGPAMRGTLRSARRACGPRGPGAASLNVLHSSSRASSRSRSSKRSSSSSSSASSSPGSRRRAFSSTRVAAMSRNSVATSRSSAVHAVELGEVRVDDLRERHLPELHLLLEDEVEQEVEGPLVDRGADRVRHRTELPAVDPLDTCIPAMRTRATLRDR